MEETSNAVQARLRDPDFTREETERQVAEGLIGTLVTAVTPDGAAPTHLLRQLLAGNSVTVEMRLLHRDGPELCALVSSPRWSEPPGQAPRAAISQLLETTSSGTRPATR
jgi:hypothetical protein